jgi:uncharacterized protein (DUF433 family)
MDWQNRITLSLKVLFGKPVIKGTRLAVELIIDLFAQDWSIDEVLRNYPAIAIADIQACFAYASASLKAETSSTAYVCAHAFLLADGDVAIKGERKQIYSDTRRENCFCDNQQIKDKK